MESSSLSPALVIENLSVSYGHLRAVRNLSLQVFPGEIFGLLGPNGAGKTSTISVVEGLLKPTAGRVSIAGIDHRSREARANMGVQLQSTSFQHELNLEEIILLYAGLYGLRLSGSDIQSVLKTLSLDSAAHKRFGQLSGGQQQRLSLFIATMHEPLLVLLDEPTTGLDPQSRRQLWSRIEGMRGQGKCVVLTTHSMEEAEAVCDRIAIMDHGEVIAIGAPDALIEKYRNKPEVIQSSRKGKITLEDVFIGLTGSLIRN